MEKNTETLRDALNKNSFKIKPILLELKNYNFFHSVQNEDRDDINNRFLGRKAIIDRLRSFIHETNKNTGTYLVSGFRGMGKTSVVNKAITSLNPKSKFSRFFLLIISLLPLIIFLEPVLAIYKYFSSSLISTKWLADLWENNSIEDFFVLLYNEFPSTYILMVSFLLFLSIIYYFGHRSPRRFHHKMWVKKIGAKFLRGFEALFNPRFYRHKYVFHRIARLCVIYIIVVLFFVLYYSFYLDRHCTGISYFEFFWFLVHIVIIWYFLIDLYVESIKYAKGKKYKSVIRKYWCVIVTKIISATLLIAALYGILYLHYHDTVVYSIWFKLVIVFLYFVIKGVLKMLNSEAKSKNYNVSLNRVINLLDFQHYITVKINLGKDNLTEKDVLKYITNELYREYRKWYYNFKSFKRLLNVFVLFLIFYLSSTIIYRTFLSNEFTNFSIDEYKITYFFPSQALLKNENKLWNSDIKFLFENETRNSTIKGYNKDIDSFIGGNGNIGYERLRVSKSILSETIEITNRNDSLRKQEIEHQSVLNKTLVYFGMFCNQLDYMTFKLWYKIRYTLLGERASRPILNKTVEDNKLLSLSKLYPKIPVLSVFFFMLALFVFYRLIPSRFRIIKNHYYSLKELKRLKTEIDASIVVEQGGSANGVKNSFLNYLKRSSYAPLESKDITQRLIHILDDTSNILSIFTKVRFIVVFDELDKINSNHNTAITNLEDEFDVENNEVRYQARRKERIGRILSSMKHFLNSAHAKFIFIAGREMYDAALAGISDRESSLDSIFNDNKIYVNSFYTEGEDNNLADISSITEQYLCQFLIPDYYLATGSKHTPSIKMYNTYLQAKSKALGLEKEEIVKIITTLKDFVVYLTYRSNGAPRKLSSLIEQYVLPVSPSELSDSEADRNIIVGSNDENLFLKIGFYDQYKFNLISYLTSPIFLGLGNYIHEYSDKLLVSISYMLDHIFKHHKFGLSYRNLSLTPEIVDINKEPQFREFLDKLIGYLTKSHLRPIVSGIYDFKFHGKIEAEIKFLSKINELEAAAFNFTLDESIELKRHFNRRLEFLKQKEADTIIHNKEGYIEDYINNVSLLHIMIGDLHFNDEEFHEAIVHYMDAIQILRQKPIKDMTLYEFIVFTRNQLKLGLAFEKNKMFDSALMTFSELTDLVIRKRNIPVRKLGLARFIIKKKDVNEFFYEKWYNEATPISEDQKKRMSKYKSEQIRSLEEFEKNDDKRELVVIGRLKPEIVKTLDNNNIDGVENWKILYPLKDMDEIYGIKESDISKNLEHIDINYKPLKNFYAQSTGENIRLLYQPIVAKLHLIEKASPDKLKDIDIIRAIKEFNFLKFTLKTTEKRLIVAEFYNKIGDLLYFKNGTLNKCLKKKLFDNIDEIDPKFVKEDIKDESKLLLVTPIDATLFYIKSLAILLKPNHDVSNERKSRDDLPIINFIDYYGIKDIKDDTCLCFESFFKNDVKRNFDKVFEKVKEMVSTSSFKERYAIDYLFSIANGIVDLVECLTSFINKYNNNTYIYKYNLNPSFIFKVLRLPLSEILNMYHYASMIYIEIQEYRLARSQKLKIFYILNQCSIDSLNSLDLENLDFADTKKERFLVPKLEALLEETIMLSYSANNETYFIEHKKVKEILECSNYNDICKNSAILLETIESVVIYWHFIFKIIKNENKIEHKNIMEDSGTLKKALVDFVTKNIVTTSTITGKNNRLLLLSLLVEYNKWVFENVSACSNFKTREEVELRYEIKEYYKSLNLEGLLKKEFLILNSIGACNEIIKTHDIFSVNYVTTSNIDIARAHYQMAFWCKKFEDLQKGKNLKGDYDLNEEELNSLLQEEILNSNNLNYIDPNYHYRLSLDYNCKVKDFHTRGSALYLFIQPISYLDDFYNDNLVHFSISIERNMLQKNYVNKKIQNIKDKNMPFNFNSFYNN
ncbi:ATP-binding protein [Hyunsoonleella ulvae]|uniref:ATP-binding protein n=1 Tax=Hyunsoonleella ulvae TaxID=2799948 RepID=UPI0019394DC3|nr:ATP-binding protein [Hyunsoonleella ulvae]